MRDNSDLRIGVLSSPCKGYKIFRGEIKAESRDRVLVTTLKT